MTSAVIYTASAPAEAHMFVGAWFLRLARPRRPHKAYPGGRVSWPIELGRSRGRGGYGLVLCGMAGAGPMRHCQVHDSHHG